MNKPLSPTVEEINYITKRARQGADSGAIATELEYTCEVKRTADDVNKIREQYRLPGHDADLARQSATTNKPHLLDKPFIDASSNEKKQTPKQGIPRSEGVSKERALSVGAVNRSEKGTPLSKQMKQAAEVPSEPIEEVVEEPKKKAPRVPMKVDFVIEPVKKPKVGETYIFESTGAMTCEEISRTTVAGFDLETATMRQKYKEFGGVVSRTPVPQISKKARQPASAETLEQILQKLEFGAHGLKGLPIPARQQKFFEDIVNGLDLNQIADVVCFFYATPGKEVSTTAQTLGDKGIRLIAAEYAHVTGQDYNAVHRRITDMVGRTKAEPVYTEKGSHIAPEDPAP